MLKKLGDSMSLKKNDIVCHVDLVGSHFCGAVSGLQNMLDCCSEFAYPYNVKFNPSKSKYFL